MPDAGSDRDATPEEAAITGGVSPAAQAPPQTRDRRSSREGFIWAFLLVGLALLLTAAFADQDSDQTLGTVIAGIALIAITIGVITGFVGLATAAVIGFLGGLLLTFVAFTASGFGVTEAMLLVAGAVTFIGSFASLAASRRGPAGRADEEARPGVESA